jgi:hypothetical protein
VGCSHGRPQSVPAAPPSHGFTSGVHGRTEKRAPGRRRSGAVWRGAASCLPTKADEVGSFEKEDKYLVREVGWGVRQMGRVGEEMRRVAQVQAEAFHVPVAVFNDFFYDFFKVNMFPKLHILPSYYCFSSGHADSDGWIDVV